MFDEKTQEGNSKRAAPEETTDNRRYSFGPAISLPKGGGAIRGIDEKFSVNPATGTASLSVPIFTTPSRQDFHPQLSLSYDSGSGNGLFGLGWSLSVPSVTRKTDKGIPKYEDEHESDIFILSGVEDLVPSPRKDGNGTPEEESYNVQRYRPRIEGLFARIERWEKTGDIHWRSVSKDNITSIYGKSSDSRITDPEDDSHVFQWLLEESHDDKGNIIVYKYEQENEENVDPSLPQEKNRLANGKSFANRYLKRIKYGNQTPYQKGDWHFEVVFDYGEHDADAPTPNDNDVQSWHPRMDAFSTFRAGFEIRTYRLCRRVLMFHIFKEESGNEPYLVRSTDLEYAENPVVTYLRSVKQSGYIRDESDGSYHKESLPPLEFDYALPQIHDEVQPIDPVSLQNLPVGLDNVSYQWLDLDGEGISGFLTEQGDSWFYKPNLGEARFGTMEQVALKPSLADLRGGQQQFLDLAGDGQKDLVLLTEGVTGFYERGVQRGWETFRRFQSVPNVNWQDPNLRMVDLNGDGHADLLVTQDDVFVWYPSHAEDGFGPSQAVSKLEDEEQGPAIVFADATQSIYLADMTGDGLSDIVRIRNGEVCYWPNMGYGRFGAKVTMGDAPFFDYPDQFDQQQIRLGDIDGTGTTDIIYLGSDGTIRLWYNQSGNTWSRPVQLAGFSGVNELSSLTVVDLLGKGTACLVWSSSFPADAQQPMRYMDLMGDQKPHLLTNIRNNMGLDRKLRYCSSTQFHLAEQAAGKPWVTRLPFPVHVLERVETYDAVSETRLVSHYRYHHGYYDGQEREFHGFGMVEQWDAESFEAGADGILQRPPVYTKSWFHTGAYLGRDRISKQLADIEYYKGDPKAVLLPDTQLPDEELTAEEERQACRALKGRLLRQEVYAQDGTDREEHPYTVSENTYQIEMLQPITEGPHGVFYVYESEVLTYHYERDPDDPRMAHAMTLEVDEYGNVRKSAAIAYPRREPAHPEQEQTLVTYTESDFINADNPEFYRIGVPYETRIYELTGNVPFTLSNLLDHVEMAKLISYEEEPDSELKQKRLVECSRTLYYDDELSDSPLPLGKIPLDKMSFHALPHTIYRMSLTPELLDGIYEGRVNDDLLANEGKYVKGHQIPVSDDIRGHDPALDDLRDNAWWIPSERQIHDPDHFYMPVQTVDPFGETYTVTYDPYHLLMIQTQDPLHNVTSAQNDYRVMQPDLVTDPNCNRSAVRFDPLGMVAATAVMGKDGEAGPEKMGDTLDDPTTRTEYELFNWMNNQRPNFVRTLARERHRDPNTRWQESYVYSDGLGREVMTKVQAEPGMAPKRDEDGELVHDDNGELVWEHTKPRWVGTGRTIYDNKGNPFKQYEPFFSDTHNFEDEDELVEWGVTPVLHYDPLSRLIRTDNPDGAFSKVEFDAWKQETWDENDTVLESDWYSERIGLPTADPERRSAELAAKHAGTPGIAHLDVLGRTFQTIEQNAILDDEGKVIGTIGYETHMNLDIEGNTLAITDARGNAAMTYMVRSLNEDGNEASMPAYDVAGQLLYQNSMDAGRRWMLNNVVGNPIRTWDNQDQCLRYAYDELQRLTHLYVSYDNSEVLAERTIYGEDHPVSETLNLRGNVYQQYDGAGVVTNEEFDFKGNLLRSSRQLAADYQYERAMDWTSLAELEDEVFTTSTEYDALNRPISLITPDNSETRSTYNEANLLERVDVRLRGSDEWTPFVTNIGYNARGQRELIEYSIKDEGSAAQAVRTEYAYDPLTFRLRNLRTTRTTDSKTLQDLSYTYDPVGNITQIRDDAQQMIFYNNCQVSPHNRYEYDALYRLIHAEGREHAGQTGNDYKPHYDHDDSTRINLPHPGDGQAMRPYTRLYEYDEVGNVRKMIHIANGGGWTRHYDYEEQNNRLLSTSLPGDPDVDKLPPRYLYDGHGNMTQMPHLAQMDWDFRDQLHKAEQGGGGKAYYVYDSAGQRVRKVWKKSANLIEERIYLGGYEVFRRRNGYGDVALERETLHVMDDKKRIALVETKTVDAEVPAPALPSTLTRYQFDNHLGSACLELDAAGELISYEEYYPYGSTSYQAVNGQVEASPKRYRYTGKERDEESGLYYHGARHYAVWLGRWVSVDPAPSSFSINRYAYAANNPVAMYDSTGLQEEWGLLSQAKYRWRQTYMGIRLAMELWAPVTIPYLNKLEIPKIAMEQPSKPIHQGGGLARLQQQAAEMASPPPEAPKITGGKPPPPVKPPESVKTSYNDPHMNRWEKAKTLGEGIKPDVLKQLKKELPHGSKPGSRGISTRAMFGIGDESEKAIKSGKAKFRAPLKFAGGSSKLIKGLKLASGALAILGEAGILAQGYESYEQLKTILEGRLLGQISEEMKIKGLEWIKFTNLFIDPKAGKLYQLKEDPINLEQLNIKLSNFGGPGGIFTSFEHRIYFFKPEFEKHSWRVWDFPNE